MKKDAPPCLRLAAFLCAAVFLLLFANPGFAQQAAMTHHVRPEVATGRAQLAGQLPANQTLNFDMVLPLRDRAGLQSFVQEVNDPASPSYHQFLTPQEVTARFGPSQEDWEALVAFAKANPKAVSFGQSTAATPAMMQTRPTNNIAHHVAGSSRVKDEPNALKPSTRQ